MFILVVNISDKNIIIHIYIKINEINKRKRKTVTNSSDFEYTTIKRTC